MTVSYHPHLNHTVLKVALGILVVGGLNWGVVAIRMLSNHSTPPTGVSVVPGVLSWAPWWVQVVVYFLVLSATIVVVGFWLPNRQCEECKCDPTIINITRNPTIRHQHELLNDVK